MDDRAPRIPAARWMIGLGRLYGGLLLCATLCTLPSVVFLGSPMYLLMTVTLAALAAGWWALVRAYEQHRRAGWWLLLGVTAVGVLWPVAGSLAGWPATVLDSLSIVVNGVPLALLLHPDSRDWVAVDSRGPVAERSGAGPGGGH
jgi:hypothetical protein